MVEQFFYTLFTVINATTVCKYIENPKSLSKGFLLMCKIIDEYLNVLKLEGV